MKCLLLQGASNLFSKPLDGCLLRMVTKPPAFLSVSVLFAFRSMFRTCTVVLSPLTTQLVVKGACCRFSMMSSCPRFWVAPDALRLRGRQQFAAGQFAGCLARKSPDVVTKHASSMCGADLDDPTVTALKLRRTFISLSSPRPLDVSKSGVWFVFTDACFDPETFSGVGAVIVDSNGKLQHFFSQDIRDELLKMINVTSRKTAILELEFFAIFCSLRVWRNFLKIAQLVVYTDNYGVRASLIACQRSSVNGEPILEAGLKIEYELGMNLWMSRHPLNPI